MMVRNQDDNCAKMKHPGSRRLFDYWSELAGGRIAPFRAEVAPHRLDGSLAKHAFIIESLGRGAARFRVAGSMLHFMFGMDMRGMSASSLVATEDQTRFGALIDGVLAGPQITVIRGGAIARAGVVREFEIILAPLRSDFNEMNRVLGAAHFFGAPDYDAAPRQCLIASVQSIQLDAAAGPVEPPLPGFADAPAPFTRDKPKLASIDGGRAKDRARSERSGPSLKIVKD